MVTKDIFASLLSSPWRSMYNVLHEWPCMPYLRDYFLPKIYVSPESCAVEASTAYLCRGYQMPSRILQSYVQWLSPIQWIVQQWFAVLLFAIWPVHDLSLRKPAWWSLSLASTPSSVCPRWLCWGHFRVLIGALPSVVLTFLHISFLWELHEVPFFSFSWYFLLFPYLPE